MNSRAGGYISPPAVQILAYFPQGEGYFRRLFSLRCQSQRAHTTYDAGCTDETDVEATREQETPRETRERHVTATPTTYGATTPQTPQAVQTKHTESRVTDRRSTHSHCTHIHDANIHSSNYQRFSSSEYLSSISNCGSVTIQSSRARCAVLQLRLCCRQCFVCTRGVSSRSHRSGTPLPGRYVSLRTPPPTPASVCRERRDSMSSRSPNPRRQRLLCLVAPPLMRSSQHVARRLPTQTGPPRSQTRPRSCRREGRRQSR
jgi:hypothetical protein